MELQRQLVQARENTGQRVEVEYREALNREAMLGRAVGESKSEHRVSSSATLQR